MKKKVIKGKLAIIIFDNAREEPFLLDLKQLMTVNPDPSTLSRFFGPTLGPGFGWDGG